MFNVRSQEVGSAESRDNMKRALADLAARRPRYALYTRYYSGEHRLAFASDKFRNAFGSLFAAFADNLCPAVVDALADRLTLTGFGVEDGTETAADDAWAIWKANRMDQRIGEAHLEALKTGDSYLVVWPARDDPHRPVIYPNRAETMTVAYDEEEPGRLLWAAKVWHSAQEKRHRLTLYYSDRIEKYATPATAVRESLALTSAPTAQAFEPYIVAGEPWPIRNPYGRVPVFHLANNASIGTCGVSELRDVVPLQDALNKSIADMLVAAEFVAYPQRWAVGLELEDDPDTGEVRKPFEPGVDRLWTVASEMAKFGEFAQADLSKFTGVQDAFRLEIARVSSTPLHYMMMITNPPSGESLKTLDVKFVRKVGDREIAFGNVWEDALGFALQIQAGAPQPVARLAAQWEDPAPASELDRAATADIWLNKLGLPEEEAWRLIGKSPEEITTLLEAKAARDAEAQRRQVTHVRELQAAAQAEMAARMQSAGPPAAQGDVIPAPTEGQ